MAASPKAEISKDRERQAWALRQKGWTQERIAAELKCSQQAVSETLQRVEKKLAAEFREQAEEIKARQTAQLERIADEALQQWLRSCEDAEKRQVVTGRAKVTELGVIPLPDQETLTTEGQSGNPALLEKAMAAMAAVRSIWGLDAPQKVEGTFNGDLKFYTTGDKVESI